MLLAMNYYRNKNVYGVNDEYERYAERLYLFIEMIKNMVNVKLVISGLLGVLFV